MHLKTHPLLEYIQVPAWHLGSEDSSSDPVLEVNNPEQITLFQSGYGVVLDDLHCSERLSMIRVGQIKHHVPIA